jgi:uncharacterized protein (TIGR01777 family)
MKNILITGGTGLLGQYLSKLLKNKGYAVRHLSRRERLDAEFPAYAWNPEKGQLDLRALQDLHGIIHLAGAGIADARWTAARKKEILDSRTQCLALLHRAFAQGQAPLPKVMVGCSAIGFYGERGEEDLPETAAAGNDFLAQTCQAWEAAYAPLRQLGLRLPLIRVGIVLSTQGGALAKMLPSYRFRLGAYFGSGQQWYAWVHLHDICRLFVEAIENDQYTQIYNGCSPQPLRNKDLAQVLAKALNKPSLILPAPAFALKLALGEMAAVVLTSTKALPQQTLQQGFVFDFANIQEALSHLLKTKI